MYSRVVLLCLAFCTFGNAVDFPGAPVNLQVDAQGDNAAITWDVVANATGYQVTLSNGQQVTARIATASFGGLATVTSYTATVVAVAGNESGEPAEITFTTRLGKVMGLQVADATETSITVEWMTNNLTESYVIRVVNEDGEELEDATINQEGGSAVIENLEPISYYRIYIRGVASPGLGEETMVRARTDGSGFKVNGVWENNGGVIGGSGMIYRPLTPPPGVYYVGVQFPCADLEYVNFWNADEDLFQTRPASGYYVLKQDELWMRAKTEIGLTFYDSNGTDCNFVNQSVEVTFGDGVELLQADNFTEIGADVGTVVDVPLDQLQWANSSDRINSAGWLKFRLDKVFHGMNYGDETNTTIDKPAYGSYVIVLSPGEECGAGGLNIVNAWGMTLKDTSSLVDAGNRFYFGQYDSDWHVSRPGFVYGYDPDICPNQFNMTATIMINGSSVENINLLPNLK